MKRGTYKIITNEGWTARDGYLFDYQGFHFGVCREHPYFEWDNCWQVTELSTGKLVGGGTGRNKTVERAKQKIDKYGLDKFRKMIEEVYENQS